MSGISSAPTVDLHARQRRQVRRTALALALLAFAVYATFILYSVLHGHR